METIRKEITSEVLLCGAGGELNPEAIGWSRRPLHTCNLLGRFPRKKKWDYWCITGDRFLFSATIAHIDYLSLGGIYFLEYDSKRFAEKGAVKIFSRQPQMAETVESTGSFCQWGLKLLFEQHDNNLVMTIHADKFKGKPLDASIAISRPREQESLNVVIPWDSKTFQFTSKQECLPASGNLVWGSETFTFTPGVSFACLDFGRGIWPYRTAWNWASFSGHSGNDIIGLNMGAKWTDGTGANENGILLNGRLYKIFEDIIFEYDDNNFMQPWRMRTASSDTVQLEFTPFYEKAGALNLLLISAGTHQMFGHFSGMLKVEGKAIPINNIMGWAEEHKARW
jgi:hypothetical protein